MNQQQENPFSYQPKSAASQSQFGMKPFENSSENNFKFNQTPINNNISNNQNYFPPYFSTNPYNVPPHMRPGMMEYSNGPYLPPSRFQGSSFSRPPYPFPPFSPSMQQHQPRPGLPGESHSRSSTPSSHSSESGIKNQTPNSNNALRIKKNNEKLDSMGDKDINNTLGKTKEVKQKNHSLKKTSDKSADLPPLHSPSHPHHPLTRENVKTEGDLLGGKMKTEKSKNKEKKIAPRKKLNGNSSQKKSQKNGESTSTKSKKDKKYKNSLFDDEEEEDDDEFEEIDDENGKRSSSSNSLPPHVSSHSSVDAGNSMTPNIPTSHQAPMSPSFNQNRSYPPYPRFHSNPAYQSYYPPYMQQPHPPQPFPPSGHNNFMSNKPGIRNEMMGGQQPFMSPSPNFSMRPPEFRPFFSSSGGRMIDNSFHYQNSSNNNLMNTANNNININNNPPSFQSGDINRLDLNKTDNNFQPLSSARSSSGESKERNQPKEKLEGKGGNNMDEEDNKNNSDDTIICTNDDEENDGSKKKSNDKKSNSKLSDGECNDAETDDDKTEDELTEEDGDYAEKLGSQANIKTKKEASPLTVSKTSTSQTSSTEEPPVKVNSNQTPLYQQQQQPPPPHNQFPPQLPHAFPSYNNTPFHPERFGSPDTKPPNPTYNPSMHPNFYYPHMNYAGPPQKRFYDGEVARHPEGMYSQNYSMYPPYSMEYPPSGYPHRPPPFPPHSFMQQNYPIQFQHRMRFPSNQDPNQQPLTSQQQHQQQQLLTAQLEASKKNSKKLLPDEQCSQDSRDERKTNDSYDESTSDTMSSFPGSHSKMDSNNQDEVENPPKKMKFYSPDGDHIDVPEHRRDFSFTSVPNFPHINMARFSKNEAFSKLMEMGPEPDRRLFLMELFNFMEAKQSPIITMPTVSKQPIDLFKLYIIVKKFGGMVDVSKNKRWRDVSSALGMGPSSSAGFVVKKNYGKFLFPFECYRDRGNIDPGPILAYLEQPIKKTNKKSHSEKPITDSRNEFQQTPQDEFMQRRPPNNSFSPSNQIMFPPMVPNGFRPGFVSNMRPANFFQEDSFPSNALRQGKFPPNPSYEHLQMVCHPSTSPQRIEKRVIGSHIQKELLFPSKSIESLRPRCYRRKRLNQKTLGQVNPWKVMMSLKSGLLCETAWALDVLSGLLADDNALPFFNLHGMPGLLEVLLDHLKATLMSLFYERFRDLHSENVDKPNDAELTNRLSVIVEKIVNSYDLDPELKILLPQKPNDTIKSDLFKLEMDRKNELKTKMKKKNNCLKNEPSEEFFLKDKKPWDLIEDPSDDDRSSCSHILTHMENSHYQQYSYDRFFGSLKLLKSQFKNSKFNLEKSNDNLTDPFVNKEVFSFNQVEKTFEEKGEEHEIYSSQNKSPVTKRSIRTSSYLYKYPEESKGTKDSNFIDHEQILNASFEEEVDCVEVRKVDDDGFNLKSDKTLELEKKALQLMNILRNLSFVPLNDFEFSKNARFLFILAKLLLLGHEHKSHQVLPKKTEDKIQNPEIQSFSCNYSTQILSSLLYRDKHQLGVSWRTIEILREDALVILANVSGQLDLSQHSEEICEPLLDGLLHWSTCSSAQASDTNIAKTAFYSNLEIGAVQPSFAMLALEASSKLCVLDSNVDLLIATPPFSRIVLLLNKLSEFIDLGATGDNEFEEETLTFMSTYQQPSNNQFVTSLSQSQQWMCDQICREFSLVLLSSFIQADPNCTRVLTLNRNFISSILNFIEVQCLKMHLSLSWGSNSPLTLVSEFSPDMLRRSVLILKNVAQNIDNCNVLLKYRERLLHLLCHKVPSGFNFDQQNNFLQSFCSSLSSILSEVLIMCSSV